MVKGQWGREWAQKPEEKSFHGERVAKPQSGCVRLWCSELSTVGPLLTGGRSRGIGYKLPFFRRKQGRGQGHRGMWVRSGFFLSWERIVYTQGPVLLCLVRDRSTAGVQGRD